MTGETSGPLRVVRRGEVLELWIDRPESRNAFSLELLRLLEAEISGAWDAGHRAIVLSGTGTVFSAGGDVKFARTLLEDPERGDPIWEDLMATFGRVVVGLRQSRCLTVSAIQGPAVGAGISLALATDVRVIAPEASLRPVWMAKGVIPDGGGSYFLARRLSSEQMFRLTLRAEPISADEAVALGLVDETAADVHERAHERALQLADRAGEALVALRRIADASSRLGLADQVTLETDELRKLRKSEDRRAALWAPR
jgi:enoyl-CoA hydratase/carnithine racemase